MRAEIIHTDIAPELTVAVAIKDAKFNFDNIF